MDTQTSIKTPLITAIEHNQLEIVKLLLQLAKKDSKEKNLLTVAIRCGHLEIIKYLIEYGYDVNTCPRSWFECKLIEGRYDIVRLLLDHGYHYCIDVSLLDGEHVNIIKYLVDYNKDNKRLLELSLKDALLNNKADVLEYVIQQGAVLDWSKCSHYLVNAIRNGYIDIVKYLHSKMIPSNTEMNEAIQNGQLGLVEYYDKDIGFIPTKEELNQQLTRAIRYNHTDIALYLMQAHGGLSHYQDIMPKLINIAIINGNLSFLQQILH